jgi:hypothetical protein
MTAPEPTPPEEVAAAAPPPSGVKFDYGGFDFDEYDAARAAAEARQACGFRQGKIGNRPRTVGRITLGLLLLGGVVTGIAAWVNHAHKIELHEAEAATAKEEHARSIAAEVMKSWDARDDWENLLFSSVGGSNTLYTVEVEKALISDRRLLVYGTIDDVKKSGEKENSIVSIQAQTRARGLDLRLSLLSPPAITNAIVAHRGRDNETFALAVKIDSVEKIAAPPDSSADGYFLAHGVLYEAEPSGLYRPLAQSELSSP